MRETYDANLGMHLLEIEITTRCNLDCEHCYNREMAIEDMPVEQIISLIRFAERNNVQSVVISGGEASLHPRFDDLAEFLLNEKPKLRMVVQTNGAIGSKDIKALKGFNVVHLSFEPDDSNIRASSVQETLGLARKLLDAGIYSYLFATVHSENLDKIGWMVKTANSLKIDIGFNLCAFTDCNERLILSAEQREVAIKKLHGLFIAGRILRFTSPLTAILKGQKEKEYKGIRGGCTAGVAACVVTPNGDVMPCPFLRIKTGNINEDSLERIWLDSNIFSTLRNRQRFEEPCASCEYLSYCGGCRKRALDYSGKLTGFDPHCLLRDTINGEPT